MFYGLFPTLSASGEAAHRILSLDMCADQYVLGLVQPRRIAGVSTQARLAESYFRGRAVEVKVVPVRLEALLGTKPDLVVRSWGGDARLLAQLDRFGIPVVQVGDVSTLIDARKQLLSMGRLLGAMPQAQTEAHALDQALIAMAHIGHGRRLLYYTPSGFTTGRGSFVGDGLSRMDFRLVGGTSGFHALGAERFLSQDADIYALGFYGNGYVARKSVGRMAPVLTKLGRHPKMIIPDQALSCPDWTVALSLERLKP